MKAALLLHVIRAVKSNAVSKKEILPYPTRGGLPKVNFHDKPRQECLLTTKVRPDADAYKLWDSSMLAVPNVDSELYRDPYYRQRMLLPTDKRPTDNNIYCIEPGGEYYEVIPRTTWIRICRKEMIGFVLQVQRSRKELHIWRGAVTIGLVDVLGKYWGKYMRSGEASPSVPCTMAAILKVKKRGISGHGFKRNNHYYRIVDTNHLPIKGMSRIQLEFHRAWINLPEPFKAVLWMHYVPIANAKEKAQALEMTKDGYRFLVDDAHEEIMRRIAARAQLNG